MLKWHGADPVVSGRDLKEKRFYHGGHHAAVTINTLDCVNCPKGSSVGAQSSKEPRSSRIYIPAKFNPVLSEGLRVLVNIQVSDQESGGQNPLPSKESWLVLAEPVNTDGGPTQTEVIWGVDGCPNGVEVHLKGLQVPYIGHNTTVAQPEVHRLSLWT